MENIALVSSIDFPVQSTPSEATQQKPKKLSPLPTASPKASGFSHKDGNQPTLGVKFISAGLAACVADLITFPLDTAKIQGEGTAAAAPRALHHTTFSPSSHSSFSLASQRAFTTVVTSAEAPKYRGMVNTIYVISQEEGVRALYNGLVPGLQRQMAFASIRIGLYDAVKQSYIDLFRANGLVSENNIGLRILAGITTGAAAVTCAQPTDVVKVRMQAQSKGVKRYTGTINAYKTIGAHEGVRGLWKGTLPNITRNGIVNAAELVSYDLIKEAILRRRLLTDNMPCHFVSAFGAGFCTTVVASPVDVVKTRYMNSAKGVYRGAFHCATTMFKEGGVFTFYKGFMPSFIRLGSWNIVMFVTFEQLKRLFSRMNSEHAAAKAPLPVTNSPSPQRYL